MRQLRYSVAASLDGYIAGPNGEFDWIVIDPGIDFAAMYAGFSGLVMGRRSYDVFVATGGAVGPALPTYVYSRTEPEGERDGVTFAADAVSHVRALKQASDGKPLWDFVIRTKQAGSMLPVLETILSEFGRRAPASAAGAPASPARPADPLPGPAIQLRTPTIPLP